MLNLPARYQELISYNPTNSFTIGRLMPKAQNAFQHRTSIATVAAGIERDTEDYFQKLSYMKIPHSPSIPNFEEWLVEAAKNANNAGCKPGQSYMVQSWHAPHGLALGVWDPGEYFGTEEARLAIHERIQPVKRIDIDFSKPHYERSEGFGFLKLVKPKHVIVDTRQAALFSAWPGKQ